MTQAQQEIHDTANRRQRVWRESLILIASPLLLYLLACLMTYHPEDPGWSRSGSVTVPIHNFGGVTGAYFSDIMLSFFGISAYLVPFALGYLIWLGIRRHDRGKGPGGRRDQGRCPGGPQGPGAKDKGPGGGHKEQRPQSERKSTRPNSMPLAVSWRRRRQKI